MSVQNNYRLLRPLSHLLSYAFTQGAHPISNPEAVNHIFREMEGYVAGTIAPHVPINVVFLGSGNMFMELLMVCHLRRRGFRVVSVTGVDPSYYGARMTHYPIDEGSIYAMAEAVHCPTLTLVSTYDELYQMVKHGLEENPDRKYVFIGVNLIIGMTLDSHDEARHAREDAIALWRLHMLSHTYPALSDLVFRITGNRIFYETFSSLARRWAASEVNARHDRNLARNRELVSNLQGLARVNGFRHRNVGFDAHVH